MFNDPDLAVFVVTPRNALERWVARALNDPRDLVFVHVIALCALVAACGVGLFFVPPHLLFWIAPLYWALWGLGVLDRFILMLHCTSHRPLFRTSHRRWNRVIPWILGPFFGQSPETYFAHHMGMHHPENNLADDLSTTLGYRRDRALDWAKYYASFMTRGLVDLARYHARKGNRRLLTSTLLGEAFFYALCIGLAFVSWRATLVVFVIPFVVVRALMMAGNWGQHAFVDPDAPGDPYRNSITCINTRYNRRCFHDGYHIHHHVKPRLHWSEYPVEFSENVAEYGRKDAIVFDGIDFFQVWLFLVTRRWNALADRFVHLPGAPVRDREAVIAFLRARSGAPELLPSPAPNEA